MKINYDKLQKLTGVNREFLEEVLGKQEFQNRSLRLTSGHNTDQLVSFPTALLAKYLGFNAVCDYFYTLDGATSVESLFIVPEPRTNRQFFCDTSCSAPSQTALVRWLRENRQMDTIVQPYYLGETTFYEFGSYSDILKEFDNGESFETYEEALENGLLNVVRMLLEQQEVL